MKIEKINDNQIKCTLYRSDLAARQLKITELAYGTEKTRGLFEDMMEQASAECGFEVNDAPVMIEATPISMDCIILTITKVDDPEDTDTDFSDFSRIGGAFSETEDEEFAAGSEDHAGNDAGEDSMDLAKFLESLRGEKPQPSSKSPQPFQVLYSFGTLEHVISFAHQVKGIYYGENSLYKNPDDGRFYLLMDKSHHELKEFARVCNSALEYGSKEPMSYAKGAFMDEHFQTMIISNALQSLADV